MISFEDKGDFNSLNTFLERLKGIAHLSDLDKYGREGVAALAAATPIDSGETASSWYYTIERSSGSVSINFHNSHIEKECPIAVILQYGHGTRNGGWVEGVDYINPAIQPIFDKIAYEAWKEASK